MTHWIMPIGREGFKVTEAVALSAVAAGQVKRCEQCSGDGTVIYHDYF